MAAPWDVDHDDMQRIGIDVDAFVVRLWVRDECPFFVSAAAVHLAGAWTPGRDPSTMKGRVQLATSPALLYTHQVRVCVRVTLCRSAARHHCILQCLDVGVAITKGAGHGLLLCRRLRVAQTTMAVVWLPWPSWGDSASRDVLLPCASAYAALFCVQSMKLPFLDALRAYSGKPYMPNAKNNVLLNRQG
jgi:hypothetical protein